MSDHPESGSLPELTPEQEATVRHLLAQARHEEPLPVEIGDRLDRVLADLAEDPSDLAPVAPVIDLATRRRRRNAAGLLVAAAAVIIGGFGVGQVIDVGGSADSDAGDSANSGLAREQSADGQAAEAAPSDDGAGGGQDAPHESKSAPLQLTSENLEQDVVQQLRRSSATANLDSGAEAPQAYGDQFSCATASPSAYGIGRLYPALYDGVPTVLALRPATGDSQEAQVLECGTGTPLRSVTVPAR